MEGRHRSKCKVFATLCVVLGPLWQSGVGGSRFCVCGQLCPQWCSTAQPSPRKQMAATTMGMNNRQFLRVRPISAALLLPMCSPKCFDRGKYSCRQMQTTTISKVQEILYWTAPFGKLSSFWSKLKLLGFLWASSARSGLGSDL